MCYLNKMSSKILYLETITADTTVNTKQHRQQQLSDRTNKTKPLGHGL